MHLTCSVRNNNNVIIYSLLGKKKNIYTQIWKKNRYELIPKSTWYIN